MWAEKAFQMDVTTPDEPTKEAKEVAVTITNNGQLSPCDDNTIKQIQSVLPNDATAEMVEGYFKEPTRILFNRLQYNEEKTTIDDKGEVTAWIDCIVKPSTYQYWDYTEVYVPSRKGGKLTIKNCKDKYVQIDGLHPNSTYTIYFIAHDINGNFNTILLNFTTPIWKKETLPAVSGESKPEELTSTIEKKEEDKPTKIVAKGLIGLEL